MPRIYIKKPKKTCSVTDGIESCPRQMLAHGLCHMHLQRNERLGHVGPVGRMTEVNVGKTCAACPGGVPCTEPATAKGHCSKHHNTKKAYGDANFPVEKRGKDGWTEEYGYIVLRRPGTRIKIRAHRLIGERHLGRELLENENVHHRNGIRHDNSIGQCFTRQGCDCEDGPHNLELWIKPQPPGQRISDLVKYARDLLKQYDPSSIVDKIDS